jgi:hypothetical protein
MRMRSGKMACLVAALWLGLAGCTSTSNGPKIRHDVWEPVLFAPLHYTDVVVSDQGPFVGVPAAAAGMLTAFPGFVASLGFVPVMPFLEFAPGEGAIAETAAFFFYIPIATGGVVATPFRIVKEVFWDLPKAAFGPASSDDAGEGEAPTAPPAGQTAPNLETTP